MSPVPIRPRLRSIRRKTALLTATVLTSAGMVGLGGAAAQAAPGPVVSAWITTPDRSQLLNPSASTQFRDGGASGQVITVDPNQRFQTMDGFGASLTDSSASLLYRLPKAQRDEVMASIFSPTRGIGMSVLRQPIGASDFVDGPHYTYNDLPAGQTDLSQSRFSIAHDEAEILPLLRQALQLNPQLKIMASPWSVPAWMKTNGSLVGGRVKDDPAYFRSYALYLLKFVQAYEEAGVPIYALTVQNEPQNRTPDAYPGTDLPVAHQNAVINELGPMLEQAGLGDVQIISYDHNWTQHPDDIADAQRLGVDPEMNYPYDALRGSAARWIDGTGFHHYAGDAGAQNALHDAFPDKGIWFTEGSGWHGAQDSFAKFFSDTLKWHSRNIQIASTRAWARAVVNWNLALNSQGGPVNGGCGNNPAGMCTGVVAIDGTTITRNAEYYTLGHMSRFVKPGAVRVGSNNAGELENVAFRNPDGGYALIVTNIGGGTQNFDIAFAGQHAAYTLPPNALATFTWTPGSGGGDDQAPTAPGDPAASAVEATSVTLGWTASTDDTGVTGYQIYRDSTLVATVPGTSTSHTDTGLTPETSYTYTVRAVDAAGNQSAPSTVVRVTTRAATGGGIDPARWYQVVNTNSGKCLDAADGGTSNGTALQQWACFSGNDNQLWRFQPTSGGDYRAVSRNNTALAWDVSGGVAATGDGASVHLWTYGGGTNQQWRPTDRGDGTFAFAARHSGKCLDVRDASTGDGARLQQWTCHNGPAQTFRLVPGT
ncbi:RICIN domain-containing protein [Actinomadura sp. 3N407]|uniref:RICIN domain-containing protein n=1 Tax=Actinomadura sp. 3N407 TaxID=3457423 RepID=UPI003FCC6E1D